MGTRGFLGVVVDDEEKITYNHRDSYPEGLGLSMLLNARALVGLGTAVELARKLRVVDERSTPTLEAIEALAPWTDLSVGEQSTSDWYCLTRGTQGRLTAILISGYILDAAGFPLDSLWCEWGYLIDLDQQRFEVYQGFQEAPHNEGRWGGRTGITREYYPVRLVASWSLDELPSDAAFLEALSGGEA